MAQDEFLSDRFKPELKDILRREGYYDLYIYYDGKFLKEDEARITPFDHGVCLGDGVFEGVRAYNGYVFKLDEHIERLFDSAKALGIEVPLTREELKHAIVLTLRRNGLRDAHIRPIITRGPGKLGLDPRRAVRASVIIMAYPFPPLLGEKAVRLIISSVRRKSPHSVDSKIKSISYIDNILAKLQANAVGADDAIMLDVNGYVGEACGENIFIVKAGRLYTPPATAALHGITRAVIMEVAGKLGYESLEKPLTPHDLYTADEVFLTGTAAEVVSVAEVDGRKIGAKAPGPVTDELIEAFKAYVREVKGTPIYE